VPRPLSGFRKPSVWLSNHRLLHRFCIPRARSQAIYLRLELYRLRLLLGIELFMRFKHRAQCRYLRARIRWILFWRWFTHNLFLWYALPRDGQSDAKSEVLSNAKKVDDASNLIILVPWTHSASFSNLPVTMFFMVLAFGLLRARFCQRCEHGLGKRSGE
jgi:hypothetical protein